MAEAQELSDRIGIIDHGKLIALGTHGELVKLVGEKTEVHLGVDKHLHEVAETWRGIAGVGSADLEDEGMLASLLVDDANAVLPAIFQAAETAGVRITSLNVVEPNLETVFLHLTGRALRE
jgi:ABC-2 type transport system ATP-binding protein